MDPICYLVRNCETDFNANNLFTGWENPSLNEAGRMAAQIAANFFSFESIGRVVSSDMLRAWETAETIQMAGTIEAAYVAPDFNLRPWNIPKFAGKEKTAERISELKASVDPNGESFGDFEKRGEFLLRYIQANEFPTVIVVQESNLMSLANHLESEIRTVEPGGIIAVYSEEGKLRMEVRLGTCK